MIDATHPNGVANPTAHTYIVLVNFNGWRDTAECIESLLRMTADNFTVVICDNASKDDSYEQLRSWLKTQASSKAPGEVFFVEGTPSTHASDQPRARVVLIQVGSNLGFSAGCNIGLRYGLARNDGAYFWLLNNDTVVDPESLSAQIRKMEARPDIGILGSTLEFYYEPGVLQCCSGHAFNTWTARVLPAARETSPDSLPTEVSVEAKLRYVCGASMFVRRQFVETVGLLSERYFLYFEEIDWATRAAGTFSLGYCSASRILHKEGRSIGSSRDRDLRSLLSEYWLSRNRVLFTRTYFPWHLPVTLLWTTGVAFSRLLRGKTAQAWTVFSGSWSGLFGLGQSPYTASSAKEKKREAKQ